jgi:dipeptidyl aminopeptidase/acylaminoacyl peptidase
VAVAWRDPQTRTRDVWVLDLARGTSSRLTFDKADDFNPVWSPDGTRIAFTSDRKGRQDLYVKSADGTGEEELIYASDEPNKGSESWLRDGRFLIMYRLSTSTRGDAFALPLSGDRKPVPLVVSPANESQFMISPNGQWLAYSASESGRSEVYVQAVGAALGLAGASKGRGKWQISNGGGSDPQWRGDGNALFYLAGQKMMEVDANGASGTFEPGLPRPLFEAPVVVEARRNRYVVTADGQRFLLNSPVEQAVNPAITVVVNWTAGPKR